MLKACLCLAAIGIPLKNNAYARIGETAQQSVERYGMETNLQQIIKERDEYEVKVLGWEQEVQAFRRAFQSEKNRPEGERVRREIQAAFAFKDYDAFKKIKEEVLKFDGWQFKAQREYVRDKFSSTDNIFQESFSDYAELRKRVLQVEKDANDYEKIGLDISPHFYDAQFEQILNATTPDQVTRAINATPPGQIYRDTLNVLRKMDGHRQYLKLLGQREALIKEKCEGKHLGLIKLQFEKNGIRIFCYLKENKTVAMIFLDDSFNESEVKQILKNNSDSKAEWYENRPETPLDKQNWEVLMKYESADGRLEGLYGKYRVSEDDLGTMRGIYIGIKGIKEIDQESRVKDL